MPRDLAVRLGFRDLGVADIIPRPGGDEAAVGHVRGAGALEQRALAEREKRAREEKMEIAAAKGSKGPWCDYLVRSLLSRTA